MSEKWVCLCSMVSKAEILDAVKKGACSVDEILENTSAGRNCGRCLPEISGLLEKYSGKLPQNPQLKINF